MPRWDTLFTYVAQAKKPFFILIYENLVRDPIKEIRLVMKFLEKNNGFKQTNLEQRLLCLAENLHGKYKRKRKARAINPYAKELKIFVNSLIDSAEKTLNEIGWKANFSSYIRTLS